MSRFTTYELTPKNKAFLKKILHFLERYYQQHWIIRRRTLMGFDYWGEGPSEDAINRRVEAVADEKLMYPNLLSFEWKGPVKLDGDQLAFDYGRCVMYWCEWKDEERSRDLVHMLLYDRQDIEWYYLRSNFGGIQDNIDDFVRFI